MNKFLKTSALSLGLLALVGCGTEGTTDSQQPGGVDLSSLLYDLPSSMASDGQSALTRTSSDSESVWDVYKPIPVYIGIAKAAKDSVSAFVSKLEAMDLPENAEVVDNGITYTVLNVDTTLLGVDLHLLRIDASKDGKKIFWLKNWKNASGENRGTFFLRIQETGDSGAAIMVRYNNFNSDSKGHRMAILVAASKDGLVGDKANDPSVLHVVAVKKNNKVYVGGVSWHPNFEDADEFWEEGAKVYAFQAVANLDKDVTVLRAAFAPDTVSVDDLYSLYALDKRVLERGTVAFKRYLSPLPVDSIKFILWSIANQKPITAIADDFQAYLDWVPTITVEQLTSEDLKSYLELNRAMILASSDEGLKQFLLFIEVKQPIFLSAGAKILGASVASGFGIDGTNLDEADVPSDPVADAVGLEPSQVEALAEIEE